MINIKTADELECMRASGRIAATVRNAVAERIVPGVTTLELSEYAGELIKSHGAESAFLGYHGYPGIICSSVNEVVVHGIPNDRLIEIGDIVSIDVGVRYNGFIGDTAATVMVEVTDPKVVKLVEVTRSALAKGIAAAVDGAHLSDVSHAIEQEGIKAGFTIVRDFVGHGVGREMHEEPQIPNFGPPGKGPILRAGMTMAIEPMINMGKPGVKVLDDDWTVVTRDNKYSAHCEHTIAVTDGAAEILTKV
ncbi:MAG: methionyl aminopeptidase [Candidatus Promineifilaceae bacterium]|jgi:methionyl aminopeptidase